MFDYFMMGDLQVHLPTLHWVLGSFWPKTAWSPFPILPIYPISPQAIFYYPGWKKVLKGKHYAEMEEAKQKNCRNTKRSQNRQVQKLFCAVEKSLDMCIASNGEYFEGD